MSPTAASAPASTRSTAYRPVLFLGLGGTGKEILLRLRLRMFERFRTFHVPFARFLWVDTDTRATDARGQDLSSALAAVGFDEHEKFALLQGTVGKDLNDIFQNPGHWPHIHEWLYPEVRRFGAEIADGAGGVRAVGRLTMFAKYAGLREAIERKLRELSQQETIVETQRFFAHHRLPSVGTDGSSAPVVFVVTSLAGGTGCGTFLDVGFLLRDIKRLSGNVAELFAYALLPNVYNASPQGEIAQRSFANAYAAFKELDHFTKRIANPESQDAKEDNPYSDFLVSWERGREKRIEGPPYSATYLIEITNQANLPISQDNRGDLFSMLAETLFLDLLPGPFSDAKRSNYSNIVQGLSGAAGANTVSQNKNVHFTQSFARRYASCGMSKMEIPLDTVRGACAAKLSTAIFDYIRREKEDADVGRAAPRDLAGAQIDLAGLYNNFGSQWKEIIHDGVSTAMGGVAPKTSEDALALRERLEKLETETVLVDSDRVGTSVRWLRQRTPTVNAEAKDRFNAMLTDRVLENPERGVATAIRKGYFDLILARTKELMDPSSAGTLGAFDRLIGEAERDVVVLRDQKNAQMRELDVALRSVPAVILAAKEQIVKIILDRVRDHQQQYLYAIAERHLLVEAKKVAAELYRGMRDTRDALAVFLDKADAIRAAAEARLQTFQTRLGNSSHVLFLQLFDAERDWPRFYKLGADPETGQPAEVDPRKEYANLLRFFEEGSGLAGLADRLRRETTAEINRQVDEFSERRFHDDMLSHPRDVSVLDHAIFRNRGSWRQALQNFVNQARPMLRRDEKMAATEVESTTFAYLGIADQTAPEAREFIDEIKQLANCRVEVFDTGKPYEVYLYFSTFAFPLPSVSLVQNECHQAYTNFYTQFNPGQARQPATGIPLHLSRKWEGRFDDLVIYTDREAELLEEVLGIVNLAPLLRVLTTRPDDATGMPDFFYKDGPPYTTNNLLGKKRNVISRLMADTHLRRALGDEVRAREAALTPAQLQAYFWGVQAQLLHPDLDEGTPDFQLLHRKFAEVYRRIQAEHPELLPNVNTDLLPYTGEEDQLSWLQSHVAGIEWPARDAYAQPTIAGLDLWRKPVVHA